EAVRTAESVVLVPDFAAHLVGGRPVHLTVRSGQGPHLAVAAGESGLHGLGLVSVGLTEACRNLFAVRPHATRGNLVVGVVGSPPLLFELRSLTTLGNGVAGSRRRAGPPGPGRASVGLTEACRTVFAVRPHATRGNLVVGVVGSPPLLFELRSLTTLGNGVAGYRQPQPRDCPGWHAVGPRRG